MTALVPFNYDMVLAAKDVAAEVGNTPFVPKSFRGHPGAVLAAILTGAEAGVGPMQAIAGFDVIEGAAKMKPELQRALVLAAGHELWYEDHSTQKVTACGQRAGSDKVTKVSWTLDDAKRAGLAGKKNWQTYPRQMLVARATGELCSLIFGDVVKGFSSGGDEDVIVLDDGAVTASAPVAIEAPVEPVARRKRKTPEAAPPPPAEPLPEDDIDEAEVVAADPETGEIPADPSTPDQRRAIGAICSSLEWEPDKRRSFAAWIAGRPISSVTELSIVEASQVIDALHDEQQRSDFDADVTAADSADDGEQAELEG